jgi:hypothetical protein
MVDDDFNMLLSWSFFEDMPIEQEEYDGTYHVLSKSIMLDKITELENKPVKLRTKPLFEYQE